MAELLAEPIEIFYAGSHVDFRGKRVTVADTEVAAAVSWFNASNQRLPMVVGHPDSEDDHFGVATKLGIVNGRAAVMEVEDVDPTFKKIVNSKELSKVSVKMRLPGHPQNKSQGIEFQHVGFFGNSRTALEKLKTAAFAVPDDKEFLFMEVGVEDLEKEASFAAERAAFEAEKAAFARAREIEPELEKWVREGRVLPREKAGFVALFVAMPEDLQVSFAAPSGEVKQSGGEFLKGFLASLEPRVIFGEMSAMRDEEKGTASFAARKGYVVDPGAVDDDARVMAYCKENGLDPEKDYERAANKVLG